MDFQDFLNAYGPRADNESRSIDRAILTLAACNFMVSDSNITMREAVEKVLKVHHQVYEVVEEADPKHARK